MQIAYKKCRVNKPEDLRYLSFTHCPTSKIKNFVNINASLHIAHAELFHKYYSKAVYLCPLTIASPWTSVAFRPNMLEKTCKANK